MASAHIEINGTATRLNAELRRFIDQLQEVADKVDEIKATYDQLALGSDWAALADALGFSDADADRETNAEAIYNILGSAQTELHATFISQLLSRLG